MPLKKDLLVNQETDIVIEGYPRSGNTYAVLAFQMFNENTKVAHHLHVPAQLNGAVKFAIPALILIRKPEEAIKSLLIRAPKYTLDVAINEYINFYNIVLKNKQYLLICDFKEIVNHFDSVIKKLNNKYNKNFNVFINSTENNQIIMEKIKYLSENIDSKVGKKGIAMPTSEKEKMKKEMVIDVRKFHICKKIYEECLQ